MFYVKLLISLTLMFLPPCLCFALYVRERPPVQSYNQAFAGAVCLTVLCVGFVAGVVVLIRTIFL